MIDLLMSSIDRWLARSIKKGYVLVCIDMENKEEESKKNKIENKERENLFMYEGSSSITEIYGS